MVVANDLLKAFSVAWWGESLTGVDSVGNEQTRYYWKVSFCNGKERTGDVAGRGGRIKRGFLKNMR